MKQSTRTFLVVHKISRVAYSFNNRAQAIRELKLRGQDIEDYELWYAYSEMARKPYSSGYAEAHRRAAREYWRRTNGKGFSSRGRPSKIKSNSVGGGVSSAILCQPGATNRNPATKQRIKQ